MSFSFGQLKQGIVRFLLSRWTATVAILSVILCSRFLIIQNIHDVCAYPLIQGAHRGSSVEFKDNTIPAFRAALQESRFQFIEFDVRFTKDHQIIVFHDRSLLRADKSFRRIYDLTYEEICNQVSYHIPLYSEVMDLAAGKKRLNIEIKTSGDLEADHDMTDLIIKDCLERQVLDNVVISSLTDEIIAYVRTQYPAVHTGLVCWISPELCLIVSKTLVKDFYRRVQELDIDYVMLHGVNLRNFELLTELKPPEVKLIVWYFNDQMFLVQKDPDDQLW